MTQVRASDAAPPADALGKPPEVGRLAARAANRERRAFEQIYKRYHQELYRYCFSILRNREDAEDALQATMASGLRSLPGEKREISLRPWLYRVAHNESISMLRQRRPAAKVAEVVDSTTVSAADQVAERDRLRQLVADLQGLPERQSSALVMRELSGLSYGEIGEAMSSSEGAARQAVYEARVALLQIEEGREMECEVVRRALSDQDGRRLRGRRMKAHLKSCDGCTGFAAAIPRRRADLEAICPALPAVAASAVLAGLLGGGGSAAGAGAAAAGGGGGLLGAGLAGTAAGKGASVLAAVVVAAGAADVGGVIDLPSPGGGSGTSESEGGAQPGPAGPAAERGSGAGESAGAGGAASGGGDAEGSRPGGGREADGSRTGAGKPPGKSAAASGQAGTSPGKSESAPGHSATPGKSDAAPGQTGSSGSSGKSETAPGQSGSSPGKSENAPGQSGVAPSSSSSPGQSATSPGLTGSAGSKGDSASSAPAASPPAPVPGGGSGSSGGGKPATPTSPKG